jgi:hypothetical protein
MDISSVLALSGGSGGTFGSLTLPAGSSGAHVPGAYYYGYVRVWNSTHPLTTFKVIPFNGFIDLRTTNTVTNFNLML